MKWVAVQVMYIQISTGWFFNTDLHLSVVANHGDEVRVQNILVDTLAGRG